MDLGLAYHGIDIVPGLIADLQQRADAGELPGTYKLADLTCDDLPGCDVILCRDCLVHLSFANVERAVANMARSGATWLITTTFTDWDGNADCEDGDWRALNMESAPFSWPQPEVLINEDCRAVRFIRRGFPSECTTAGDEPGRQAQVGVSVVVSPVPVSASSVDTLSPST